MSNRRLLLVAGLMMTAGLALATVAARTHAAPSRDGYAKVPAGAAKANALARSARTPSKVSLKVLFIGNSQMMSWNLPQMIQALAESAPADSPRIEPGQVLRNSAGLRRSPCLERRN